MRQFDDIFSRKVKEAFNSFDADDLAEEGWNSYVKKYGKKPSLALYFPLWAKVASIAIMLTIGVLYTNRIIDRNAGESADQLTKETQSELTEPAIKEQATTEDNLMIADSDPVSEVTIRNAGQDSFSIVENTRSEVSELTGSLIINTVKADETPGDMHLPVNPVETRLVDDADAKLKLNPEKALPVLADIPREKRTTTLMTGLSGMMASIDNTPSTAQGVSFGFYVEQQLTRRISVRPGLAMAKHNYGMESTSGGSMALDYAAPELDGLSGTTTSYEANIEVLSMEIPVNFVFSLRKRSGSNLFVTTGASTVIYLNQHLSGSFNNTYIRSTVDAATGGVSYESKTTSVKIESEQEPLTGVDFLGLANFSAGYSIPFGKTRHLLFEPFVQLPLKDLTSLDLRIRYGGLSMKIQF
ncbi:MAG: PorT family protein [Bacteroidales bacterium]|jgi:hypothetical protein|nr:PorT family protein [Bacteroidales bacterium]